MTQKITPCLYCSGEAEEAAEFYASIFADASMGTIARYPDDKFMPAGTAMSIDFKLCGQQFQMLNGPSFERTEAISFSVNCDDQAEIDRYWDRLTADGGSPGPCGWLKDKYGFSWQIVPRDVLALAGQGGPGAARMMEALNGMSKLDIAKLDTAFRGEG